MNNELEIVVVVCGGDSEEREVSLRSGAAVYEALQKSPWKVLKWDPSTDAMPPFSRDKTILFNALHGSSGEDGTYQAEWESAGYCFTGSGSKTSHNGFLKSLAKQIWSDANLTTPAAIILNANDFASSEAQIESLGLGPYFVKSESQGSSIGVYRVERKEQLAAAVQSEFERSSTVLVEQAIHGREFTVAIMGSIVFPPIEIQVDDQFYDYESKYANPKTRYITQPVLNNDQHETITQCARKAYDEIGAEGLARVDLILDDFDTPYLLEINTSPGMTQRSTAPMAANTYGWSFEKLCQEICLEAWRRH